jgi:hypothetical protein
VVHELANEPNARQPSHTSHPWSDPSATASRG